MPTPEKEAVYIEVPAYPVSKRAPARTHLRQAFTHAPGMSSHLFWFRASPPNLSNHLRGRSDGSLLVCWIGHLLIKN